MNKVPIHDANTLFTCLEGAYNYFSDIKGYCLDKKTKKKGNPKYFTKDYAEKIINGSITVPRIN